MRKCTHPCYFQNNYVASIATTAQSDEGLEEYNGRTTEEDGDNAMELHPADAMELWIQTQEMESLMTMLKS